VGDRRAEFELLVFNLKQALEAAERFLKEVPYVPKEIPEGYSPVIDTDGAVTYEKNKD